jgi:hypothetical protein
MEHPDPLIKMIQLTWEQFNSTFEVCGDNSDYCIVSDTCVKQYDTPELEGKRKFFEENTNILVKMYSYFSKREIPPIAEMLEFNSLIDRYVTEFNSTVEDFTTYSRIYVNMVISNTSN